MQIQRKQIEQAYVIDQIVKTEAIEKRKIERTAKQAIEYVFPKAASTMKETNKKDEVRRIAELILSVEEKYGVTESYTAKKIIEASVIHNSLLDFIMQHIDRVGLDDKATIAQLTEALDYNTRSFNRILANLYWRIKEKNQWRIALKLKLTPEEAQEFQTVCRAQLTEYDCVMMTCVSLAEFDPIYYEFDKVEEMMTFWFGEKENDTYITIPLNERGE